MLVDVITGGVLLCRPASFGGPGRIEALLKEAMREDRPSFPFQIKSQSILIYLTCFCYTLTSLLCPYNSVLHFSLIPLQTPPSLPKHITTRASHPPNLVRWYRHLRPRHPGLQHHPPLQPLPPHLLPTMVPASKPHPNGNGTSPPPPLLLGQRHLHHPRRRNPPHRRPRRPRLPPGPTSLRRALPPLLRFRARGPCTP